MMMSYADFAENYTGLSWAYIDNNFGAEDIEEIGDAYDDYKRDYMRKNAGLMRLKKETYKTARELGYYIVCPTLKSRIECAETEGDVIRVMIGCRHAMMLRDGDVI